MTAQKQIKDYIAAQPESKRSEMLELHSMILAMMPACKLWFLDGKDERERSFPTLTSDMDPKILDMPMEKPGSSIKLASVLIRQAFPSTLWELRTKTTSPRHSDEISAKQA
jgi:hypothetical protein